MRHYKDISIGIKVDKTKAMLAHEAIYLPPTRYCPSLNKKHTSVKPLSKKNWLYELISKLSFRPTKRCR